MKPRILVVGRGHLGRFLKQRLGVPDVLFWTKDMSALNAGELRELAPDVVVNAAGKTDLRWCEDNARECWRNNVEAPLGTFRAFREALPREALYVQMSSGCVWDGPYRKDGKPFGPYDEPCPASFYAWCKAACDAIMLREAAGRRICILRPRQIYSPMPNPRNVLGKLATYANLIDTPNSMTSAETVAKTIEVLAQPEGASAIGRILCVYDRGITSPYEVGRLMAKAGLRSQPNKLAKQDLDVFCTPKRVDTILSDSLFESLVDPPVVQDEVAKVIAEYAHATGAGHAGID